MKQETRRERERATRESDIIAAAERIFGEKGFEAASMDEIAVAAQFTKRTVYIYFQSKEELFFAAALGGYRKLFETLRAASSPDATGYQKLVDGSRAYYSFYREHGGILRMIGEVGAVKKRAKADSPRLREFLKLDGELFRRVADAVAEGKADGSVRADVDPAMSAYCVVFMMTGFFNQLSQTGPTFLGHFGLDAKSFSDYSMGLLLGSIRGKA